MSLSPFNFGVLSPLFSISLSWILIQLFLFFSHSTHTQGGYDLTCIAESMAECVKVLLGDSPPRLTATATSPTLPTATNTASTPSPSGDNNHHFDAHLHAATPPAKANEDLNVCAVETIKKVIAYHCSHWPALALNYDLPLMDQYFYKQ